MTRERLTAIACLLGAASLIAIAFQCIPEQRTLTEAPTPTVRVIVLPSQTPFVFATATSLPAATEVPMLPTSTRVPATATQEPTVAPTDIPTPSQPAVQRG